MSEHFLQAAKAVLDEPDKERLKMAVEAFTKIKAEYQKHVEMEAFFASCQNNPHAARQQVSRLAFDLRVDPMGDFEE